VIGMLRRRRPRDRELALSRDFSVSIAGGPTAPRAARDLVLQRLDGSLGPARRETVRLLVSELATNCVLHAGADAASHIDLAVSLSPGAVRVEVSTAAPSFALRSSAVTTSEMPGGRGLCIVDTLSQRWGIAPHAPNTVWFELAVID
jgi:serine/threonine-protein kinase RsbW